MESISHDTEESRWRIAVRSWLDTGSGDLLAATVRELCPSIPEDARELLADLAAGAAKRKRGPKAKRSGQKERDIMNAVFAERFRLESVTGRRAEARPYEKSAEIVAKRVGTTAKTITGVLDDNKGYTFEFWMKYIRPR